MRKLLLVILFLLLTACGSRETPEYVRDVQPLEPAACWQTEARTVLLDLPEQAETVGENAWKIGELEVEQRLFLASSVESAAQTLSGLPADRLTILESTRQNLPRAQFTWVEDETVCRADFLLEGQRCYAVLCRRPAHTGDAYDEQIRQILSTFRLDQDQQV